jgi:hypothetical protein
MREEKKKGSGEEFQSEVADLRDMWWYLPFAVIANTYTTCPYRQAAVPVFHGHKGESAEGRKLRKKN